MTQQPINQYEAIDIAQHIANQIGGPVKVTHLGHAKGGSQIGQKPRPASPTPLSTQSPNRPGTGSEKRKHHAQVQSAGRRGRERRRR